MCFPAANIQGKSYTKVAPKLKKSLIFEQKKLNYFRARKKKGGGVQKKHSKYAIISLEIELGIVQPRVGDLSSNCGNTPTLRSTVRCHSLVTYLSRIAEIQNKDFLVQVKVAKLMYLVI
jgi:hypothetical protein